MEPSRRNQWQSAANRPAAETAEQAKSVAVGCDWLPRASNGKEGVDGSSPSEGFAKALQSARFVFGSTCSSSCVQWVWSRFEQGNEHLILLELPDHSRRT
jgi:hypothetical protein